MDPNTCVFCAIAAGTLPATVEYQDEHSLAFRDAHPMAPVHILVIPRRHIVSLAGADPEETRVAADLILVVKRVADQLGLGARGYRVVTNAGTEAGQTVPHLHWHLLAGRPMRWPPG